LAYTKVSEEEAVNLLKSAGLTGLQTMEPLEGGWANSNYLLTMEDESQLVLKVWDERGPKEVMLVIEHTCWLAEHGVPTPVPLMLNNGKRMLTKGGLAWMLMPFIAGGWLPADPASMRELGRVQALMHTTPVCESISRTFSIGFVLWERLIREHPPSEFLELLAKEMQTLKQSIPENLPQGIIHGDLYPDNVIGCGGEVFALLDFEEICVDSLAIDLVTTFVGFGWQDGLARADVWNALLEGYQSVRPLTPAEHAALPDLHRFAVLAVAAWRYWQFVINIPGTEHADRYLEMVERLDKELPF
jgi:homoserine kinase type II